MFNVAYELSQSMGKTEFSFTQDRDICVIKPEPTILITPMSSHPG